MGTRALFIASVFSLVVWCTGCGDSGGKDDKPLTYDEFMIRLPDAICDYYLACGKIKSGERSTCPADINDDVERNSCNAARGLFAQLEPSLRSCVNGEKKPCASTDDLSLFCPQLSLLEDQCQ
jgi:hypothetical protein